MNDYEKKKQARISRYKENAEKNAEVSNKLFDRPETWDKASEAMSKSKYYAEKAKAAENNKAISSDDPEAIQKLRDKLEQYNVDHKRMIDLNKYYRKHKTCKGFPGLSDESAAKSDAMIESTPFMNAPFASYSLQSINQEEKRLEQRIAQLETRNSDYFPGWEFDGGYVEANKEDNRLQIFFDEKPSPEDRAQLKNNGFRWSPSVGAWQRQLSRNAYYAAGWVDAIKPESGKKPYELLPPKAPAKKEPTR